MFINLLYRSVLLCIEYAVYKHDRPRIFNKSQEFFFTLRQRKPKINTKKRKLFANRVKWCGKFAQGEGIEHDLERIATLRKLLVAWRGLQNI